VSNLDAPDNEHGVAMRHEKDTIEASFKAFSATSDATCPLRTRGRFAEGADYAANLQRLEQAPQRDWYNCKVLAAARVI
jgi:hypothetical protein